MNKYFVFMLLVVLFTLFLNLSYSSDHVVELNISEIQAKTIVSKRPDFIGMDLCGTIINSKESDIRAVNKTIKKFLNKNWEWKDIKHLKKPELSMKQNFPIFFGKNYKRAYRYYLRAMYSEIENVKVFDGVFEFLQFCRANNIKTAIVTNRDVEYVKKFESNNKLGKKLLSLVDVVVTADEAKATKPHPEILKYAIQKVGINSDSDQNLFFIGDALADSNLVRNDVINGNFILMAQTTSDIDKDHLSFLSSDSNSYIFLDYFSLLKSLKNLTTNDTLKH